MTLAMPLETRPLKPGFGAEILDVDLGDASDETLAEVVATFHRYGAILLRDQAMAPDALVRFGRAFGPLEAHTVQDYLLPAHPEIYVLSNRVEDGRPVGAHNDGIGWHTDHNFKAEPVMCTMLHAKIVPPEGSDTLLADQVAAYAALTATKKAMLDPLRLQHSFTFLVQMREHGRKPILPEILAANPDVIHPLIRTHPADGRKALWVSGGTRGFVGMDQADSLALVDELIAFVTEERFVYCHVWRVGDVLVWDNRCTLHTGTLFDDTRYVREMHRLWVKGDTPV
ncbi:MAG: TauD/TfdA dioxygenase family protein [Janthinobacterium lividum]